jgi:hypothetical protein
MSEPQNERKNFRLEGTRMFTSESAGKQVRSICEYLRIREHSCPFATTLLKARPNSPRAKDWGASLFYYFVYEAFR